MPRASLAAVVGFGLAMMAGAVAHATVGDAAVDCLSEDNKRRIEGCSSMLEDPGLTDEQRSLAYGMRALAYSLTGMFDKAIADYDEALKLRPDYAVALNNRAWAYYKLGRMQDGRRDVERSLALVPGSPYALDTRAHIHQAEGDQQAAYHDYDLAMRTGGEEVVKMYQCGLRAQGLYFGALDGSYSAAVRQAMRTCSGNRHCDPLPSDSECRPEVS